MQSLGKFFTIWQIDRQQIRNEYTSKMSVADPPLYFESAQNLSKVGVQSPAHFCKSAVPLTTF